MPNHDRNLAPPNQARGLHVLLVLLDQRRAPHNARELHPVRQADGEDQHPDRHLITVLDRGDALGDPEDQHGNKNGRECELHIRDPHDDRFGPTAEVAGNQAQRHAEDRGK